MAFMLLQFLLLLRVFLLTKLTRAVLLTGSFGWRSDKHRSSSEFVFLPFSNSTDNMVQGGWQVGRDTLQPSWEQCWASMLHLEFCQNNSDGMLMLVRRRVPILYPVLRFSTREDAICSSLPQPHVPFPFNFALKGPSV